MKSIMSGHRKATIHIFREVFVFVFVFLPRRQGERHIGCILHAFACRLVAAVWNSGMRRMKSGLSNREWKLIGDVCHERGTVE